MKQTKISELDSIVEILETVSVKSPDSGASSDTKQVLDKVHAKRVNVSGDEEDDGKLKTLSVRKYIIRYWERVANEGTEMFVRDYDGDYNIQSVEPLGRRYMLLLRCVKSA